jgi:hypothetical protein
MRMRKAIRLAPLLLAVAGGPAVAGDAPPGATDGIPRPNTVAAHTSPQMSAAITSGLPKYDPVAAAAPKPVRPLEPGATAVGETVRLPTFVISSGHTPIFSRRTLAAPAELSTWLSKQYPGSSRRSQDPTRIDGLTPNYAVLQSIEDRNRAQAEDFNKVADTLLKVGDKLEGDDLKDEIQRAFMRREDDLIEAMDTSANGGRR